jgi:hypothetical protein
MKKIIKKQTVVKSTEVEVPIYITDDGLEFNNEQGAADHEELIKKYSKLNIKDIKWIEGYLSSDEAWSDETCFDGGKNFEKALKSNKVLVLGDHSGRENPFFEVVEPYLVAVEAVIKVLHRKSVGMGCNRYICGVIYLGESLCFNEGEKMYYEVGSGRNIKEVLK